MQLFFCFGSLGRPTFTERTLATASIRKSNGRHAKGRPRNTNRTLVDMSPASIDTMVPSISYFILRVLFRDPGDCRLAKLFSTSR